MEAQAARGLGDVAFAIGHHAIDVLPFRPGERRGLGDIDGWKLAALRSGEGL